MPKPFPAPISIGTDICHIPRILQIITKEQGRKASHFVSKILTHDEIIASKDRLGALDFLGLERKPHPAQLAKSYRNQIDVADKKMVLMAEQMADRDEILSRTATFLAGRFAAKEATIKAHRKRRLGFHDIIIKAGPLRDNKPTAPTAMVRPWNAGSEWEEVMLSISHDGAYAIASVLAAEGLEGQALMRNWHRMLPQLGERSDKVELLTDESKGVWSVFVGNVPAEASEADLRTAFARFGTVGQTVIARRKDGQPVGYGFVGFKSKEAAENALNSRQPVYVHGLQVLARPGKPRQEIRQPGEAIMQALGFDINRNDRRAEFGVEPSKGVYSVIVKNLTRETTELDLTMAFGHLLSFLRAVVSRLRDGRSLRYGFVAFGSIEDVRTVMGMNRKIKVNGGVLDVGRSFVDSRMIVSARDNGTVSLLSEMDVEYDDSAEEEANGDDPVISHRGGMLRLQYPAMKLEDIKRKQGEEVEFWIKAQEILRS